MQTNNSISTAPKHSVKSDKTIKPKPNRKKISRQDWEEWIDGFSNMVVNKAMSL